jgi:TM2 domain-containing membrane protein YozV
VSALGIQLDDDLDVSTYVSPNTKYCHHCGVKIAALAEICPKCGVRQPGQAEKTGQISGSSPNKVVACLLACFLGWLGAHRFYLGETTWGVFYIFMNILLFWTVIVPVIFAIICLIEGLVYLTYKDSDFAEKYARE